MKQDCEHKESFENYLVRIGAICFQTLLLSEGESTIWIVFALSWIYIAPVIA